LIAAAIVFLYLARKLYVRLQLSRAKHRSLTGHSRMARRFASLVPFYEYDDATFFRRIRRPPSGCGAAQRFMRLAQLLTLPGQTNALPKPRVSPARSRIWISPRAIGCPSSSADTFAATSRPARSCKSSGGVMVTDLDGNQYYDVTGSYGVNVFGYDFYKGCIERGSARVRDLGPVLGAYHPVVAYNVRRLLEISGLEEISFHMSGTEAVMQAVRLARYHTKRTHLVRFCGAYHGWWGDVQPGVGNPVTERETYTLDDMSEAALKVLRTRRDIACVLVNPLQALHPNAAHREIPR
jgi:glutamate-1-semialdehyde 2,1-aminomutase